MQIIDYIAWLAGVMMVLGSLLVTVFTLGFSQDRVMTAVVVASLAIYAIFRSAHHVDMLNSKIRRLEEKR